eukprot:scaffold51416_cov65-Phaeocystis_antarctica.AAC.4
MAAARERSAHLPEASTPAPTILTASPSTRPRVEMASGGVHRCSGQRCSTRSTAMFHPRPQTAPPVQICGICAGSEYRNSMAVTSATTTRSGSDAAVSTLSAAGANVGQSRAPCAQAACCTSPVGVARRMHEAAVSTTSGATNTPVHRTGVAPELPSLQMATTAEGASGCALMTVPWSMLCTHRRRWITSRREAAPRIISIGQLRRTGRLGRQARRRQP